jgi:phosphoglycerate kinase
MKIKMIKDIKKLSGKRVLLRVDLNVPIKDGKIEDDFKIIKQLPTIKFLLESNAKVILFTHLGRPKIGADNKHLSVKPICKRLSGVLHKNIKFIPECIGFEAGTAVADMNDGDIVMLENIRFEDGEKKNDRSLAKELAKLADIYVNNAFAVSHRAEASVDAIKNYLPSFAGFLLIDEVKHLRKVFVEPEKPLIVIIGGSKIATKINLIKQFNNSAHRILIGGALANNFFVAHNIRVGKSLIDTDTIEFAKSFKNKNILLPVDVIVNNQVDGDRVRVRKINEIKEDDCIYDIGPETIKLYAGFIKKAKTLIWNGPLGMFEKKSYSNGTLAIARLIATVSSGYAYGVAGGGETVEALKATKMMDHVDWVSTGGGAMLAYLGGENMPGLKKII